MSGGAVLELLAVTAGTDRMSEDAGFGLGY